MLIDTTPLVTIGQHTVITEQHDVLFKDGTTVGLHYVQNNGHPAMYLRCLVHDHLHAVLLDVRDLAPALAAELPLAQPHDVPGLVLYTMRGRYSGAAEFTAAAIKQLRASAVLEGMPRHQLPLAFGAERTAPYCRPDLEDRRYAPTHIAGRAYA